MNPPFDAASRTLRWAGRLVLGLLCLGLLAGCSPAEPTPLATTPAPGWRLTLVPSWTPTPEGQIAPTLTPTPLPPTYTPTPGPSPTYNPVPVFDPQAGITLEQLADPGGGALSGLIVFSSAAPRPFNFSPSVLSIDEVPSASPQGGPWLWGFSPDGQRAARLTLDDLSFAAYLPPDPAGQALFVGYGVSYSHPAIQTISLPEECYGVLPANEAEMGEALSCSDFQFSPDGRLLGFNFGPQVCGRGIILMDTQNGQVLYRSEAGTGHSFEFLSNGKVLLGTGHCEGGWLSLFDPLTGSLVQLGASGVTTWNEDHTALVTRASRGLGLQSAVWGYNVSLDLVFMPEPASWELDTHPLWVPGGQYLLYQHRSLSYDGAQYAFNGSNAILLVDALTGQQAALLSNPLYDYRLCPGLDGDCDIWYGDWVQVQRVAFEAQSAPDDGNLFSGPGISCLVYGVDCIPGPELLALNWRTGELVAWDTTALPTAQPPAANLEISALSGPNLELPPVFEHPTGDYSYYLGLDGHSLWLVTAAGKSELWVSQGNDFLYLP